MSRIDKCLSTVPGKKKYILIFRRFEVIFNCISYVTENPLET